jgi:CBS domain-containing protein
MQCREVMTQNPAVCTRHDSVVASAILMKAQDVGPIPVVDSAQKLIGIVTDRDLALKVVAENRDPRKTKVEEVMTKDPVTVSPEDGLDRAIDAMARFHVRRIPVVDHEHHLVGIIAQADIARTESPEKTGWVVAGISEA